MYKRNNSGFTLVEIAIVLVIIGLLLGGVLKGQEMITNAKIKRITSDFEGVAAAIFSYQDRYRALPGDDARASARWGNTATDGNGNGVMAGTWNSQNDADETRLFWHHLRNSSLIAGETANGNNSTTFVQPTNSLGGNIGVQVGNFGLPGVVICMNQIDGANAEIVDLQSDDGNPATGNVRGSDQETANAGSNTAYAAGTSYTICRKL